MTSLARLCRQLLLLIGAAMLAGCSALSALDALTPRDAGGRLAAKSVAYGVHSRQKLDVFVPVAALPNAPVLVFFYGGSWKSGTKDDYEFVGQALAAQGFLTLIADYRLFPQARYTDFLADSAAAVRWAVDNAATYGGDGSRILLAGHSAGAYNAAMVALDQRYLRQAGVDPRNIRAFAACLVPTTSCRSIRAPRRRYSAPSPTRRRRNRSPSCARPPRRHFWRPATRTRPSGRRTR